MKQEEEEQQNPSLTLLDALYCEEEKWLEEEEEESEVYSSNDNDDNNPSLFPLFLLDQDLFWEDEELLSLFSKEEQQKQEPHYLDLVGGLEGGDSSLRLARREAVDWVLKVNAHYGFTALTAVLAINYLDRFLSSLSFQRDKPWTIQLVAVTCLSLAAKVEETQVPLLLDLQVRTKLISYTHHFFNKILFFFKI